MLKLETPSLQILCASTDPPGDLHRSQWAYLIVDEGQRVKNRNCRLIRELKCLDTQNRLLLSGTPIQNTLEELWSLLNFVNPAIFDNLEIFQSW